MPAATLKPNDPLSNTETGGMNEFWLGKVRVPYTLHRSAAATRVRIEMTMDEMRVTVPAEADDDAIKAALYKKRRWIIENRADLDYKLSQAHKIARFRTGAKIPFWGRLVRLTTKTGDVESVAYRSGFVVTLPDQTSPSEHDDIVEAALQNWMRDRLGQEARRFCQQYAKRLSNDYAGLRITPLRTRWGSCGANGIVSLDWHLVLLHYAGPRFSHNAQTSDHDSQRALRSASYCSFQGFHELLQSHQSGSSLCCCEQHTSSSQHHRYGHARTVNAPSYKYSSHAEDT